MATSITGHPNFPQPQNPNAFIWKYISLSKFLNFILTKTLYLTRIDLLGDPHEGANTKKNPLSPFDLINNGEFVEKRLERNLRMRKSMFVNCWRLDDYESEAMWKLYCPNSEGVAIKTTYQKLADSVEKTNATFIGLITYLDYEKDYFDNGNVFSVTMHKRKAFEHEKEVRIVRAETQYWTENSAPNTELGLSLPTTLFENIEAIYVNPYAPEWYFETILKLFEQLDLNIPLKWSEIKSTPFY